MEEKLKSLAEYFLIEGEPIRFSHIGNGHINETFKITTSTGHQYILQKINTEIFKNPDGLMDNMVGITEYLHSKGYDDRHAMTVIRAKDLKPYHCTDGTYWRVVLFIKDSICLQSPRTKEDFRESAIGFGRFQNDLINYPVEKLVDTIPGFHNTENRFKQLHEAILNDAARRVESVRAEIDFLLEREKDASYLLAMQKEGILPTRVTHNDTKLNNVLLDAKTYKALCVIDLDTVMPGLNSYDYGDAIRFGASTAAEDEKDLSKVKLDLEMVESFTDGFIKACPGLTEEEKKALPWGARIITLEQACRFLTDYLNGDIYYHTKYAGQNLDRTRTQIKLVAEIEDNWSKINSFIVL